MSALNSTAVEQRRFEKEEVVELWQLSACLLEGFECRNFSGSKHAFANLKSNSQPSQGLLQKTESLVLIPSIALVMTKTGI